LIRFLNGSAIDTSPRGRPARGSTDQHRQWGPIVAVTPRTMPPAFDHAQGYPTRRRPVFGRNVVATSQPLAATAGLRMLAAGAADVVVLKPAMLGGAERALELAAMARQAAMEVVFTHAFESAVGARHALHCAAAWGDARGIHGLATAGLFEADVAEPVCARDGGVAVPAAPGLGVAR